MWDLPGPGIEPMSSVLAGRSWATGPLGKSHLFCLYLFSLKKRDRFPRFFYCPAWQAIAWYSSGSQVVHAGWGLNPQVHVHLNTMFSVRCTSVLNLPGILWSRDSVLFSPKNKPPFSSGWRWALAWVSLIWGRDLVVCVSETTFLQSSLRAS